MASVRGDDMTDPYALSRFGGWTGLTSNATGFFRVECQGPRWWLIDPDGAVFFSVSLNHLSSSALRAPKNIDKFLARYGTEEGWIRAGLVPDLKQWGFNTIGWTQEIAFRYAPRDPMKIADKIDVRRGWGDRFALAHDRPWEHERYAWTGMPYCHVFNFLNAAYYCDAVPWASDVAPQYPDVFSTDFEDYCDFIARSACTQMRADPNLIGYFYSDVPDWYGEVHSNHWLKGFPGSDTARQRRLYEIATR